MTASATRQVYAWVLGFSLAFVVLGLVACGGSDQSSASRGETARKSGSAGYSTYSGRD
jgi:hypothetical protein